MANLEIKLSANKRQPYTRHRIVGRVGDDGLTTIDVQLLDSDERTPFVLNPAGSIKFVGQNSKGEFTDGFPTIVDASTGLISYTFSKDNFSEVSQFRKAYFEYTDPVSKKVTFQDFIVDVLPRADISAEQAQYYIATLEKLLEDFNIEFERFILDSTLEYEKIYMKYNELVSLVNSTDETLDHLNEELVKLENLIGNLGNFSVVYSNNIDFGDYDYSGNPNLAPNLKYSDARASGNATIEDNGTSLSYTSEAGAVGTVLLPFSPYLPNKTYTLTIKLRLDETSIPSFSSFIGVSYSIPSSGAPQYTNIIRTTAMELGVEKTYTHTITTEEIVDASGWALRLYTAGGDLIKYDLSYEVKLEAGASSTPHQPNLLEAPWQFSTVPLQDNLGNNSVTFPRTSTSSTVYSTNMIEPFVIGQEYTIRIRANKPNANSLRAFNSSSSSAYQLGIFQPVEGLADVYEVKFTATSTNISTTHPSLLQVVQYPLASPGSVTLQWLKIEKGTVATPNISQYKYFGEGLQYSNNPNDYSWDLTPEYVDRNLKNSMNLTDPQTALGLKNFQDGIQVNGVHVRKKHSLPWTKLSVTGKASGNFFHARRDGDIITLSGPITIEPITSWTENVISELTPDFLIAVLPDLNTITWSVISEDGRTHALVRVKSDGKLAVMQTYGDTSSSKTYWISQIFPAAVSNE